jgi:hypothetical protein
MPSACRAGVLAALAGLVVGVRADLLDALLGQPGQFADVCACR